MRSEFRYTVLLPALLIALLGACAAVAQDEDATAAPGFNGTWVLNRESSRDLAAMMQPPAERGGGGGMRGGGRGRRGGRDDLPTGGDNSVKRQQNALRMQKEYSRLEIFHEGQELNLTDGLDISQLHFTDGRETVIWTERGEMTARTTIAPGEIRVHTGGRRDGPGRTRTFTLSEDGKQLVLVEERGVPGREAPVRIRMVYDRAD